MANWTEELKAGDTVVIRTGYDDKDGGRVAKVARVTATQVVIDGESAHSHYRFRRDNGRLVGGTNSWRPTTIAEPTPELMARMRVLRDLAYLRRVSWMCVPDEVVTRFAREIRALTTVKVEE